MISEEENKDLAPKDAISTIKEKDTELISQIVEETDVDKLKDLTHLFNAFQTKRKILRLNALNDVQDALVKQMKDRLEIYPNNFDNADISSWMKVVQQTIDSEIKHVDEIKDIPSITYQNNTQININNNGESLSRESREKITEILQQILESNNIRDVSEIDTTETNENNDSLED